MLLSARRTNKLTLHHSKSHLVEGVLQVQLMMTILHQILDLHHSEITPVYQEGSRPIDPQTLVTVVLLVADHLLIEGVQANPSSVLEGEVMMPLDDQMTFMLEGKRTFPLL